MRCSLCDRNTLEHGRTKFYPDPTDRTKFLCAPCRKSIIDVRTEWNIIDEEKEMDDLLKRLFE